MMKMPRQELRPDRPDTQNTARFLDILNAETEAGKYKILAQLLTNEFKPFKKARPI
ncbi:MAG TPA: hypothetical protein VNY75_02020 [Rhizomicrobium sp.]|nr:hypothetical protein [Rhizomicrobium sp.]